MKLKNLRFFFNFQQTKKLRIFIRSSLRE